MALLDSELARIKAELGYNVLTTGAVPYIGVSQVFEQVIKQNVLSGASTTSSTAVTAASTATVVSLTLASGTGFSTGDRVVVDVDDFQEIATARSVSGVALSVALKKAHTGTYTVTVEGGETIVRENLARIRETKDKLASQFGSGALKKVDEVEFYQVAGNVSAFGVLGQNLMWWREQLAACLGLTPMWQVRASGAQQMSVY